MELNPGYKQTDVGVIPVDWKVFALSDVADVRDGTHDSPRYVSSGVPFVTSKNILSGKIDFTDIKYISHRDAILVDKRSKVDFGDILISMIGTVGNAALVDFEPDFSIKNVGLIKPNVELVESKLIIQYLFSNQFKAYLDNKLAGGIQKFVSLGMLRSIEFPAPSKKIEQRAIATALSDVDALLDGLDRLIAKKRDIKQAAMQQLLTGKTRLPGFEGEWEKIGLKRLVQTPITDGPHMTPRFLDSGVPFLSVNNLVDNRIDLSDLRYISKADDQVFARKCKPRKGDVLLGKAASVGKVAIVEDDLDFNIWSPIALVRVNNQINAKFLYYQLQSADCVGQIVLLTNSSSQGNIGMGDIEMLQISFPSTGEQVAIASVLSDMDAEIEALEKRRTKTRGLKQAMMQELLTGRTRLV